MQKSMALGGWMGGWMDDGAVLRIAFSNQKILAVFFVFLDVKIYTSD